MKKMMFLVMTMCLVSAALADQTWTYGWEDGETVMGTYNPITATSDSTYAHDGSLLSVKLVDGGGSTPQAYMAWISDLQDGDVVTASFWCYDETGYDEYPKGRMWGHYTNGDLNAYAGSPSLGSDYSAGPGWTLLDYSWTFDSDGGTRDGWVVEARTYTDAGDTVWIDDITVIAPDHATVYFPGTGTQIQDPNGVDYSYDWDDGNGTLLTYYDGGNGYQITDVNNVPDPDPNYTGDNALHVVLVDTGWNETGPAAKARVAWITGLQAGDKITAKIAGYDPVASDYQSVSIGASYCSDSDVTAYDGDILPYADSYTSDGAGWSDVQYQWTFAAEGNPNRAVLIEAVFWGSYSEPIQEFYVDDITVTIPEHATVVFPDDMYKTTKTESFGWESPAFDAANNQPLFVGTFNAVDAELQIDAGSAPEGSQYVKITEADVYQVNGYYDEDNADEGHYTGRGYVAWITGLQTNDQVYATIQGRALSTYSSLGMSGHYTYDNGEIDSYAGDAGRTWVFADDDTSWTTLKKLWVVSGESYIDAENNVHVPNGLIVEIRPYDLYEEGGYIDDLTLVVPDYATVTFPDKTGDPICLGDSDQRPEYDLNNDCTVDLSDIALIASEWLKCSNSTCN